jgi:hypothetical protein
VRRLERGVLVEPHKRAPLLWHSYGLVLEYVNSLDYKHQMVQVYYNNRLFVFPEHFLQEIG